MSVAPDPLTAGLYEIKNGSTCRFLMLARVHKDYVKSLSLHDRARIEKTMESYAAGNTSMPDTLLKRESREKVGDKKGTEVAVWAFKGHQGRAYGAFLVIDDKRIFICSEVDVKKTNRADPACLRRAATNLRELIEGGATP